MLKNDLSEIDHTILKTLGITEEQLLTLPEEYQKAFLFYDWQLCNNRDLGSNLKKELEKSDFDNIEKVKQKILTLFKKK